MDLQFATHSAVLHGTTGGKMVLVIFQHKYAKELSVGILMVNSVMPETKLWIWDK